MRLLFITIEFSIATFSGNGIYGMGQVRALRAHGHQVLVLCGRPAASASTTDVPAEQQTIALPTWGCLDEKSSWREFAEGAGDDAIAAAMAAFQPQAALGVDWHSLGAWQRLQQHRLCTSLAPAPFFYLNYRVYSRTATGAGHELLQEKERECMAAAATVVCLSRSDADHIRTHLMPAGAAVQQPQVHVLLPALRADVAALPQLVKATSGAGRQAGQWQGWSQAGSSQRCFLTCCVRLSPEKEPHRFVEIIEALARRPAVAGASAGTMALEAACNNSWTNGWPAVQPVNDSSSSTGLRSADHATAAALQGGGGGGGGKKGNRLQQLGMVPLLCGAADTEYAAELRARLRLAAPDAFIEQQFLSSMQLAEVFAATRLNIHPCGYDAFGMTIVEAASQGAPSLVTSGGAVGATDLLSGAAAECFEADMTQPPEQLASEVERVLSDEAALAAVGAAAARKARSWTEDANAKQLTVIVEAAMKGQAPPHCAPTNTGSVNRTR